MFASLTVLAVAVIGTGVAIHLGTRAFLGARADHLPGGAMGFALIQSFIHMEASWAPSMWLMVPMLMVCAIAGHLMSVGMFHVLSQPKT